MYRLSDTIRSQPDFQAGGGTPPALDTTTDNSDTPPAGRRAPLELLFRQQRYIYLEQRLMDSRRTYCNRGAGLGKLPALRGIEKARFGQFAKCGEESCPCCSVSRARIRGERILAIAAPHLAAGGAILFLTLTARHSADMPLEWLLTNFQHAWKDMTAPPKKIRDLRAALGYSGMVRVLEVTHSWHNGWHPHFHVAIFVGRTPTPEELEEFHDALFRRWEAALKKRGVTVLKRGTDLQAWNGAASTMTDYLAKDLSLEMTAGYAKEARTARGTSNIWGYLDRGLSGDKRSMEIYEEYHRAMVGGKRKIITATGNLLPNQEEYELMKLEAEATQDPVNFFLEPREWSRSGGLHVIAPEALRITEEQGPDAARAWIEAHGIGTIDLEEGQRRLTQEALLKPLRGAAGRFRGMVYEHPDY